jgi:multiple sugar transport system permease protein
VSTLNEKGLSKPKIKWILHALLIIGSFFMIVPFIWMVLTSLKSFGESTHVPPIIFPAKFIWKNYADVFTSMPFGLFYWNTFITTVYKTAGQLLFCSLAAYAFARIVFPGRSAMFILLLSILMVPSQAYLIPQYLMMVDLGWLNTLKAITVPGLFSAFGTFLLRQFFMTIPRELEEAAKLDGCNHLRIYFNVMLPIARSGMIALAIFTILWSWNDLMWPLIVNSSPDKMTLSVGLASLQGQYMTNFPLLMASAVLASWPMILLFIVMQRHFVEGIALTGTKG